VVVTRLRLTAVPHVAGRVVGAVPLVTRRVVGTDVRGARGRVVVAGSERRPGPDRRGGDQDSGGSEDRDALHEVLLEVVVGVIHGRRIPVAVAIGRWS
jgi:hypothetical protein